MRGDCPPDLARVSDDLELMPAVQPPPVAVTVVRDEAVLSLGVLRL